MPLLSTRGAASIRPLGFGFFATIPEIYYIGLIGLGTGVSIESVAVDANKNLYLGGNAGSTPQLIKVSSSGVLLFQKSISNGTPFDIDCSASGDLYIATGFSNQAVAYKFNSSGTPQWGATLNGPVTDLYFGAAVNATGTEVYFTGRVPISSNDSLGLVKYNSSGTLQWQVALDSAGTPDQGREVVVGPDGFIYVVGSTGSNILIAKYNSSGVLQAQYRSSTAATAYGIAVDSSSNIYIAGSVGTSGSLTKLDGSGAWQWSAGLGTANITELRGVAVAASGNVYVTGRSGQPSGGAYNDFIIAKYDSGGTLQWQRILSIGAGGAVAQSLTIDQQENIYVGGYGTATTTNMLFAKLPPDGSLTGTYNVGGVSIVYAVSTVGTNGAGFTPTSASLTASTTSHTAGTGVPSTADTTLSNSIRLLLPPPTSVEYLVVAGGGGGGGTSTSTQGHGGGGAGGFRTGTLAVASGSALTVTVGGGGAINTAGSNSVFSSITSAGGGLGSDARTTLGGNGGSGGGGSAGSAGASNGGSGNTPSVSPSQGSNGGNAFSNGSNGYGGGGGGASAAGATATNGVGGVGGAGTASSISGSSVTYSGGGGGGAATGTEGAGGAGGGGKGAGSTASVLGTANTGGGGGGGGNNQAGKAGGSGVVIIRYQDIYNFASATTGSPTVTTSGGYRIYTWTGSGSITF